MADGAAGSKSPFGFLATKAGPLPVGIWLLAGAGIWYYLKGKNASPAGAAGAGQQTDPAGNTGVIDPQTGYVYDTPQDVAALQSESAIAAGQSSGTGTSGSTTAGQYADNNSWAQAAINYLVARGVDPTQATDAIESYLASQPLTSQQQADVNLAIQGLGAPPSVPGPASTAPGQVVTPPGGSGGSTGGLNGVPIGQSTADLLGQQIAASQPASSSGGQPDRYPAPGGLSAYNVSSTGYRLRWNAVTGPNGETPTGYTVATYQLNGVKVDQFTTGGTDTSEYGSGGGGLHPGWSYKTQVWANGGKQAPPGATVAVTLKAK